MAFYNEDDKKDFFTTFEQTKPAVRNWTSLFNNAALYENKFGKDLYNFNSAEAIEFLRGMNQRSMQSLNSIKASFAIYTNWAIEKGLTLSNQNVWTTLELNSKMIVDKVSNTLIKDRLEFIRLTNAYVEHPYRRLVLFLLYEGFIGQEYSEIRFAMDDDLDIDKKTLRIVRNGQKQFLPVSNELIAVYKATISYNEFDKQGSPYLIKNRVKGQSISSSVVNKYVYRFIDAIALKTNHRSEYTATSIWKSGMYDYIHRNEIERGGISDDIFKEAAERYGYNINNKLHLLRKEYGLYKEAFKL